MSHPRPDWSTVTRHPNLPGSRPVAVAATAGPCVGCGDPVQAGDVIAHDQHLERPGYDEPAAHVRDGWCGGCCLDGTRQAPRARSGKAGSDTEGAA